ncbi:MAG: alcohol dehydrogenase catalytic domain-containing protein [Chthoniobacterales bacterium]
MKVLLSHNHLSQVEELPRPLLQEGDVLLRVEACGVCFSDLHKIRFRTLNRPTVLGHEVAGTVVEIGGTERRFAVGDRVVAAHHVPCLKCHHCERESFSMCRQFKATNLDPGGFAEFVRVPATHVESVAFPIPHHLTFPEASFMEPLGCCLRAVERAGIRTGDVVVLVGLGSIGLLMMQLIRHAGSECVGLDLDPRRREFARSLRLDASFAEAGAEFKETLARVSNDRGADAIVLTAATPALVRAASSWLRNGGTLLAFASLHPESNVALDWNELYYREIKLVTSYSSAPADLAEALDLLANGGVQVAALTGNTFPLEQFDAAVAAIESRTILKAIMTPHA